MKYFVTLFWAITITQVTFYLGAQLTKMTYKPMHALALALIVSLVVFVSAKILPPIEKDDASHDASHTH